MIAISGVRVTVHTLLVLHLSVLAWSYADDSSDAVVYGCKVRFDLNRTLHFPDFEVTYMGKCHVTPSQYPHGWWVHDFKARSKGNEQTISWSAGTGDIGPSHFKVDGADFQIELSRSDKLGPLREDEMVVSSTKLL